MCAVLEGHRRTNQGPGHRQPGSQSELEISPHGGASCKARQVRIISCFWPQPDPRNRRFWGSGRPLRPPNPSEKLRGDAPHLFRWVLGPPGPPRPPKSTISGLAAANIMRELLICIVRCPGLGAGPQHHTLCGVPGGGAGTRTSAQCAMFRSAAGPAIVFGPEAGLRHTGCQLCRILMPGFPRDVRIRGPRHIGTVVHFGPRSSSMDCFENFMRTYSVTILVQAQRQPASLQIAFAVFAAHPGR